MDAMWREDNNMYLSTANRMVNGETRRLRIRENGKEDDEVKSSKYETG